MVSFNSFAELVEEMTKGAAMKPQLTNFPALHQLLRNSPQANTEFNAYIGMLTTPGANIDREKEYESALESERKRAAECDERAKKAEALASKAVRFIRILGELIESQHQLNPYMQDVSNKNHYDIRFSPGQIRMALRWYWDVLGSKMEEALSRGIEDPVDNEDET